MSKQQFTTEAAGPVAVTVVVSTRNRRYKIEACARALAALRCRLRWQCVIIDNGSSDGTLERLRELATVLSPRLEIVSEPRAGVSRGRNAGIRAARGEFIAMTDDDCLPDSDFLDAVLEVFADPAIGYYGGRVLLHDSADYPITIKTSTQREEFPPGTVLRPGALHGANFGFRRAVLERIGGFDPTLGPGFHRFGGGPRARDPRVVRGLGRRLRSATDGAARPWPTHARFHPFAGSRVRRGARRLLPACRAARWCREMALKHWYWSMWFTRYRGIRRLAREALGAAYWLAANARRRVPEPLFPRC